VQIFLITSSDYHNALKDILIIYHSFVWIIDGNKR